MTQTSSGRGGRGRGNTSEGGRGGGGRGGGGRGGGGGRNVNNPNNNNKKSKPTAIAMHTRSKDGPPPPASASGPKMNKADKKMGRRAKQVAAMDKKAFEEDRYFKQCQREAAASSNNNNNHNNNNANNASTPSEKDLFGTQGTQGINFKNYDDIKVEVRHSLSSSGYTTLQCFNDIPSMNAGLKRNIERMRYQLPTPIQKHSIPLAVSKQDLMCCAQTGSGKTCAFLLPVIISTTTKGAGNNNNNIGSNGNTVGGAAVPTCLILAPTRELALQIELEAQKLTFQMRELETVCVYGGANARGQLKQLAYAGAMANTLLVVATPGRLTDFVDRGIVSLSSVQFLVLDEADRMLDMGFEPQIRKLVQRSGMPAPDRRQTLLFSATFPPAIQKLAGEFLRKDYAWIAVGRVGSTTNSIKQVIVKSTNNKRDKLKLTVKALTLGPDGRTLIFVKKKRDATWLKKQLSKGGPDDGKPDERFTPITAQDIHGDRSQSQRENALAEFRSGKVRILVATDVAARGLDISGVEHVINMDLPNARDEFDSYVHRIGRTGRAGHTGLATSLFVPGDDPKTGNGRIAALLVAQLKESNQEVPAWLESQVHGDGGGAKRKSAFGGSDVRKETEGPSRQHNRGGGGGSSGGRGGGRGNGGRDRSTGGRGGGRGSGGGGRS